MLSAPSARPSGHKSSGVGGVDEKGAEAWCVCPKSCQGRWEQNNVLIGDSVGPDSTAAAFPVQSAAFQAPPSSDGEGETGGLNPVATQCSQFKH